VGLSYLTRAETIGVLKTADAITYEVAPGEFVPVTFVQALRHLYDVTDAGNARFGVLTEERDGRRVVHVSAPTYQRAAG